MHMYILVLGGHVKRDVEGDRFVPRSHRRSNKKGSQLGQKYEDTK